MSLHRSDQQFEGDVHIVTPPALVSPRGLGWSFYPFGRVPLMISGNESSSLFSAIGGTNLTGSYGAGGLIREAPVLVGYRNLDTSVYASTDDGNTWDEVHRSPGNSSPDDVHCDIVCYKGGCLVACRDDALGIGNMGALFSDGNDSFTSVLHSVFGFTLAADTQARFAVDAVNELWIAAGYNGSQLRLLYKTDASGIGNSGGWTANNVSGLTSQARALAVAYNDDMSAAKWIAVGGTPAYAWVDGSAPATDATVSMTGIFNFNLRQVVYNRYWRKVMFLGPSVNFGGIAAAVTSYDNIGSATASNYEIRTITTSPGVVLGSATLQEYGAACAVGPWCYFQTEKGGSGSGILGTPDMGKTWYYQTILGHAVSGNHLPMQSLGAYNGRLVFLTSRLSETSSFGMYATPVLDMDQPVGYTA